MAILIRAEDEVEVPDRLPVVALRDLVFFPYIVLPILVGRRRSVAALEAAQEKEGLVLNFIFTDVEETHVVEIENGVLHHHQAPPREGANATMKLTRVAWDQIVTGKASLPGLLRTRSLGSPPSWPEAFIVYSHAPVAGRRGFEALSVPYEVYVPLLNSDT